MTDRQPTPPAQPVGPTDYRSDEEKALGTRKK